MWIVRSVFCVLLQKIRNMKVKLSNLFDLSGDNGMDDERRILIAFKFGDGKKIDYKFSYDSTIQVIIYLLID